MKALFCPTAAPPFPPAPPIGLKTTKGEISCKWHILLLPSDNTCHDHMVTIHSNEALYRVLPSDLSLSTRAIFVIFKMFLSHYSRGTDWVESIQGLRKQVLPVPALVRPTRRLIVDQMFWIVSWQDMTICEKIDSLQPSNEAEFCGLPEASILPTAGWSTVEEKCPSTTRPELEVAMTKCPWDAVASPYGKRESREVHDAPGSNSPGNVHAWIDIGGNRYITLDYISFSRRFYPKRLTISAFQPRVQTKNNKNTESNISST